MHPHACACIRPFACKQNNMLVIHSSHEHMQTQTRTLPLERTHSNLILSCASKSDISGWLLCVRATFAHRFCGYRPDKSADRGRRYVPGGRRGRFRSEGFYLEDVMPFQRRQILIAGFPSMISSPSYPTLSNGAWLSCRCLRILPRMHQSPRGKLWSWPFPPSVNDSTCVYDWAFNDLTRKVFTVDTMKSYLGTINWLQAVGRVE